MICDYSECKASLTIEIMTVITIAARGCAEHFMNVVSFTPERFSEDARNEASVPFLLSAGCSALHAHPDGRTVPLGGRLGLVQPAS